MQKIMASIEGSVWPFANVMVRSWGLKRVISGRETVVAEEEEGKNCVGGEREDMSSGGSQWGAIWAARSVPDAELPMMRTFCQWFSRWDMQV